MTEKIYALTVSSDDTLESIAEFLQKGGITVAEQSAEVIDRSIKDGVEPAPGTIRARVVTPEELGMTGQVSCIDFYEKALTMSLAALSPQAAMRLVLSVPNLNKVVRCGMEPLPDHSGYDFVFTYWYGEDGAPILDAEFSGLYDATHLLEPDQPVVFRDTRPVIA